MNDVSQKSKFLDSIDMLLRITIPSYWTFTCSKSTIVTLEQYAISVQS